MYWFYFVIEEDPADPAARGERVRAISDAAQVVGTGYEAVIEIRERYTTVQVEIADDVDAIAFKLTVPPALEEGRSP